MSNRIRYKKTNKEGVLESVRIFTSSKRSINGLYPTYRVKLDLNDMTYKIINMRNQESAKKGGEGINNLAVLKRNAKKALESLFVEFDSEIRDNECRKNKIINIEEMENI